MYLYVCMCIYKSIYSYINVCVFRPLFNCFDLLFSRMNTTHALSFECFFFVWKEASGLLDWLSTVHMFAHYILCLTAPIMSF